MQQLQTSSTERLCRGTRLAHTSRRVYPLVLNWEHLVCRISPALPDADVFAYHVEGIKKMFASNRHIKTSYNKHVANIDRSVIARNNQTSEFQTTNYKLCANIAISPSIHQTFSLIFPLPSSISFVCICLSNEYSISLIDASFSNWLLDSKVNWSISMVD